MADSNQTSSEMQGTELKQDVTTSSGFVVVTNENSIGRTQSDDHNDCHQNHDVFRDVPDLDHQKDEITTNSEDPVHDTQSIGRVEKPNAHDESRPPLSEKPHVVEESHSVSPRNEQDGDLIVAEMLESCGNPMDSDQPAQVNKRSDETPSAVQNEAPSLEAKIIADALESRQCASAGNAIEPAENENDPFNGSTNSETSASKPPVETKNSVSTIASYSATPNVHASPVKIETDLLPKVKTSPKRGNLQNYGIVCVFLLVAVVFCLRVHSSSFGAQSPAPSTTTVGVAAPQAFQNVTEVEMKPAALKIPGSVIRDSTAKYKVKDVGGSHQIISVGIHTRVGRVVTKVVEAVLRCLDAVRSVFDNTLFKGMRANK